MSWLNWAAGVCAGVGGSLSSTNEDTLNAWSNAETAPFDLMHINNPLNTTEPWAGARDWNAVGVKIYATEQDGINATVATLLNGRYPTIVSHLQNSVPRSQWGDACAELDTWGTGCGWLNAVFGPGSGSLTGDDFLSALSNAAQINMAFRIDDIWKALVNSDDAAAESFAPGTPRPVPGIIAPVPQSIANIQAQISNVILPQLQEIQTKVNAATTPGTVDLSPVLDALKALTLKAA